MKTNNDDIEQLLVGEKKLTLSTDERNSIKSTILAHARESLRHEKQVYISPWTSWRLRSAVSFASLLLVFMGTAYASQDSLPGEPLYAMKVHIVEEMIALTKTEPQERVAYDSKLMETRLSELKMLNEQETNPSREIVALVADQIDEHVTDVTDTIISSDTSDLPHEKKIASLSRIKAIAKAQSRVTEGQDRFADVTEITTNAEENTSNAISATVEDFAREKPVEVINDYLSKQMDALSDQILATSTDEIVRDSVEESLHNVDESLVDGAINDAIILITEAQQIIMTDQYVEKGNENNKTNDTNSN